MTVPRIVGNCHCNSISYAVNFPPETKLPIDASYDHSTDLRLAIGFLCAFYSAVPSEYFTHEDNSSTLTTYTTGSKKLSFCGKCGATLFFTDEQHSGKTLILAPTISISASTSGSAPRDETGVATFRDFIVPKQHIFLEETFRGGVARYMDDGLPRFARGADGELWKPEEQEHEVQKGDIMDQELLEGGCHCGGAKFSIKRADENYKEDSMLKEWVKPGRKYCASHCFCHSCRIVSGAPFWVWAFIPLKQIHFTTDDTHLRIYESTKTSQRTVLRRFCSRCGCHLFFTSTFTDFKMWDVSVAALDQRAYGQKDWFLWRYEPGGEKVIVDQYIDNWNLEKMGFEEIGKEYHPELVDEATRGLLKNM